MPLFPLAYMDSSESNEIGLSAQYQSFNTPPTMVRLEDTQYVRSEDRKGDSLAFYTTTVSAGVISLVTWAIIINNNPTSLGWFALHPTLQSIAIILLILGILTLQPTSQPSTKSAGLKRHQALMISSLFFMALGTFSIVWNKYSQGSAHFTTWHGTLGILLWVLLMGQFALGASSVWCDGAALGGGLKAKQLWKYHRLSGYILVPMILITVNLGGAWSNWSIGHSAWGMHFITYTVAPLFLLLALYARIRLSKIPFLLK